MRIETTTSPQNTGCYPRYQPTYEELKQDRVAKLPGDLLRYQPTYEELKPILNSPSLSTR